MTNKTTIETLKKLRDYHWDTDEDKNYLALDHAISVLEKGEECSYCGSPFLSHHNRLIHRSGSYFHTGCFEKSKAEKPAKVRYIFKIEKLDLDKTYLDGASNGQVIDRLNQLIDSHNALVERVKEI